MYDILIKNIRVIDKVTDKIVDIGIANSQISKIAKDIDRRKAEHIINGTGKFLMPGIIDPHVHLSKRHGGSAGQKMLVKNGVTTAFDLGGLIEEVLDITDKYSYGMNIASINQIKPGVTVKDENPDRKELKQSLDNALEKGALGYKLLGGHFPLTPQTIHDAIAVANEEIAYVAFHAGSTQTGSNLNGALEAIELAGENMLHLAHINSYCRGQIKDVLDESIEILSALDKHKNIISESYLSPFNGTSAKFENGVPESDVTKKCLQMGGYDLSKEGLKKAFMDEYANLSVIIGGENVLINGEEAQRIIKENDYVGTLSFPVNPALSRYYIATHKDEKDDFTVSAFSSDGGAIPRNEILYRGLSLCKFGSITLKEFAEKASYAGAKIMGLNKKGLVKEGYDADLIIVDYDRQITDTTIINGNIVYHKGIVQKYPSTFLTTEKGMKYLEKYSFNKKIINLKDSYLYNKNLD